MIQVVCGIIFKAEKIFLCRRSSDKLLGGYWEFPGGKIEENENAQDALKRELFEEIAMIVDILDHYITVRHKYENFEIELSAYKCTFKCSNFDLTDHDKYEWLEPKDIQNKKLAPADLPILNKLLSQK